MIDPGSTSAEIGTPLKDSGEELIYHSNRLQSKGIQRATFDYYFRKLRGEILDAIHDGALCDEPKSAETCGRLCNECQSLFVYVHNEGVSPTNSAAEQALRKSVIFRKLCFGTEARTASQNLAVIMSVTETCRRMGRRPFDYLTDAVKAAFSTQPAPKLLSQN